MQHKYTTIDIFYCQLILIIKLYGYIAFLLISNMWNADLTILFTNQLTSYSINPFPRVLVFAAFRDPTISTMAVHESPKAL